MTKWVLLFAAVALAMVEMMASSARGVKAAQKTPVVPDYSQIRSVLAESLVAPYLAQSTLSWAPSNLSADQEARLVRAVSALDSDKTKAVVRWCVFDLKNTYYFGTNTTSSYAVGSHRPEDVVAGYFEVEHRPVGATVPSNRLVLCEGAAETGTVNDALVYAGKVARTNVYLSEVTGGSAFVPSSIAEQDTPPGALRYFPQERALKLNAGDGTWRPVIGSTVPTTPSIGEGSPEMVYVQASSVYGVTVPGFWIGTWPAGIDGKGAAVHSPKISPVRSLTQQQAAAACAARGWKLPTFKQWLATGTPSTLYAVTTRFYQDQAGNARDPIAVNSATADESRLSLPTYDLGVFEWTRDTSDRSAYPSMPAAAGGLYFSYAAQGLVLSGAANATASSLGGFMPALAYVPSSLTAGAVLSTTIPSAPVSGGQSPAHRYVQKILLPGYPATASTTQTLNLVKNTVAQFPDYCTGYCSNVAAVAVRPDEWYAPAAGVTSPYRISASTALFVGRSYATPASPAADDIVVGFRCVKSIE